MSTLLCVYLKMESLDHMEVIFLIYWEITKHILQDGTALCSHQIVSPPVPSLVLNTVCPAVKFNIFVAFICFSQGWIILRIFFIGVLPMCRSYSETWLCKPFSNFSWQVAIIVNSPLWWQKWIIHFQVISPLKLFITHLFTSHGSQQAIRRS